MSLSGSGRDGTIRLTRGDADLWSHNWESQFHWSCLYQGYARWELLETGLRVRRSIVGIVMLCIFQELSVPSPLPPKWPPLAHIQPQPWQDSPLWRKVWSGPPPSPAFPTLSGGEGAHQQPDELDHSDLRTMSDCCRHHLPSGGDLSESHHRDIKQPARWKGEAIVGVQPDERSVGEQLRREVEHLCQPQDFCQVPKTFQWTNYRQNSFCEFSSGTARWQHTLALGRKRPRLCWQRTLQGCIIASLLSPSYCDGCSMFIEVYFQDAWLGGQGDSQQQRGGVQRLQPHRLWHLWRRCQRRDDARSYNLGAGDLIFQSLVFDSLQIVLKIYCQSPHSL